MSWSFYSIGRPKTVLKKARSDLTLYKCLEPEEGIKMSVLDIMDSALSAFPDDSAVEVTAMGSQSSMVTGKNKCINSLTVIIKPLHGFLE